MSFSPNGNIVYAERSIEAVGCGKQPEPKENSYKASRAGETRTRDQGIMSPLL